MGLLGWLQFHGDAEDEGKRLKALSGCLLSELSAHGPRKLLGKLFLDSGNINMLAVYSG